MKTFKTLLFITGLLFTGSLFAQQAGLQEPVTEDIPPPPPLEDGQPLEPEVTIIQKEQATVEEYRANGHLFMVKITPRHGKPYYLRDTDGDGYLESRISEIYSDMVIPQWVIFSWD